MGEGDYPRKCKGETLSAGRPAALQLKSPELGESTVVSADQKTLELRQEPKHPVHSTSL